MREKDNVSMNADQTLKVLTAINDSNVPANLQTIYLKHFDEDREPIKYCELSGEGAYDLLWSILQKAHNLVNLQLPRFEDIRFDDDGIEINEISDKSKKFMQFLVSHSSLCKNLPYFSADD